jgi:hypothetical protein
MDGFCRDGLVTGVGGGYLVTAEAARLAAIPAGRSRGHLVPNLAREMLIGTWLPGRWCPPSTSSPSGGTSTSAASGAPRACSRRWACWSRLMILRCELRGSTGVT